MKSNNLNLGKALSKDEQKQIKGGTTYCSAGQYAYCTCGCIAFTSIGPCYDGSSTGACCQSVCGTPPVNPGSCYTDSTCGA